MTDFGDAEMMLRVVANARCDGEEAGVWLGRPECMQGLLTIMIVNMRQAGLSKPSDMPLVIDHAIEVLSQDTGQAPSIQASQLQRLGDLMGRSFLPPTCRDRIGETAGLLAGQVRAMATQAAPAEL